MQKPPTSPDTDLPVPPGYMEPSDLADYEALNQEPTRVGYRGYDVYGMAPSSSGGTTVGEALNIMERYDLADVRPEPTPCTTTSRRPRSPSPTGRSTSATRRSSTCPSRTCSPTSTPPSGPARSTEDRAATKPVAAGDVDDYDGECATTPVGQRRRTDNENISTTNLTVADKWGNVVEYTLTIEQTGGSGIVVPDRGFLLNNELTDFSWSTTRATPTGSSPASARAPRCRRRSC